MKKWLAFAMTLAMLLSLAACGGTTSSSSSSSSSSAAGDSSGEDSGSGDESSAADTGRFDALQEVDEPVSLYLYWHNLQPTPNTEPTEEAPNVLNACRYLTEDWLEAHPNVTIDWCRNLETTDEWITVNYTAGNGPDTLFYWGGAKWVEQGMALILNDIMASPNYYEPGSPVWKDMYPEYLFDGTESTRMAINERGDIIAVPVVMAPGSDTAYYYNKDLAEELGLSDVAATRSWKQLKENILTAREAGYTGTVIYYHGFGLDGGGSWDAQFSLNAAYLTPMIPDNDYDGDGKVMAAETMRKQYETGYWYLENNPAMVEYWNEYFWKVQHGIEEGGLDIDYTQPWADGKVLYIEEGLWSIVTYASNTELTFDVGMFPPPYQQPEDSQYVVEVEWTDAGPYQPAISTAFNIMDPALQNRPEYTVDYVVDWMKWALTNDNLSIQVEEAAGVVGATKGCKIPSMMAEWFQQSFPKKPGGYGYLIPNMTDLVSTSYVALNQEYMFGMIDEATFIHDYDELMYQGLLNYIETYPDKLADWEETYGWSVDDWTNPVKPSWM